MQRRWASVVMGLCLIGATLAVTTYEKQRPTINLGSIATATSGSKCQSPPASLVSHLRSTYISSHPQATRGTTQVQPVVVVGDSTSCTLLPGLEAVGPSYGMGFKNAAVIACGVVSGEIAPLYGPNGLNLSAPTKLCQGEANRAETEAIERYRPSLIIWGSTDERDAVVSDTPAGSKILTPGSSQWRSVMLRRMDDRVEKFIATGARVIMLSEPPSVHSGGPTGLNSNDIEYREMNALQRDVRGATSEAGRRCQPSGPGLPFRTTLPIRGRRVRLEGKDSSSGNLKRDPARPDPLLANLITLGRKVVGAANFCGSQQALVTSYG